MMLRSTVHALGLVLLVGAPSISARADTPPTALDIASMSSVDDVRLSPDGSRVVYSLTTRRQKPDATLDEKDTMGGWEVERQLWVAPAINEQELATIRERAAQLQQPLDWTQAPRQLTFGTDKAGDPRWRPDGQAIAFIRAREGKDRLHILPLSGGEAQVVDTGELEPSSIAWSSDARSLAFLATPPETQEQKTARWQRGGASVVGEEWRNARLYTVSVPEGELRQVTDGTDHIVEFDWSPDNQRFAVIASESSDPYFAISLHTVRIISAENGVTLTPLEAIATQCADVRWSPNGEAVAFLSAGRQSLSLMGNLMVYQQSRKRVTNMTSGAELALQSVAWSPDSRSIYALSYDRTRTRLDRIAIDNGFRESLGVTPRAIEPGLDSSRATPRLAFRSSTVDEPIDPSVLDLLNPAGNPISDTQRLRVVARVNPQEQAWPDPRAEIIKWVNADGIQLEGILLRPAGAVDPLPLMVFPHGGPDSVSTERHGGWARFFAARGWAVFMPNYRGGIGYGTEFYRANRGRLGEIELADIESGVDHLITRQIAIPDRMVYGGWSWGGFCTAFTIGRTTRYKAAVVGAGVADTVAQYATSDINRGHVAAWEFKGDPWRTPENFARANPLRSATSIKTPTLILHGEEDERVGYVNAVLLHRALLDLKVPTRFVSYPREPHGFKEPAHVAHMLDEWANWCQRHLTGSAAP